jgi:hypothetical protein
MHESTDISGLSRQSGWLAAIPVLVALGVLMVVLLVLSIPGAIQMKLDGRKK